MSAARTRLMEQIDILEKTIESNQDKMFHLQEQISEYKQENKSHIEKIKSLIKELRSLEGEEKSQ